MGVTLTPETEAKIRQRLIPGRYDDADAVVQDALHLLEEREQLEHLCSLVNVGLEAAQRGESVAYTPALMDEIYREAEEMFLRGEEPDPDVSP